MTTPPMKKKVKKRKIVVLEDGDGTTWACDARIVEVPKSLMEELQNDSKSIRDYPGSNVFDLEAEHEVLHLALRDLVEQLGTGKVDLRPYRPEMASALQQAKTVLRKLDAPGEYVQATHTGRTQSAEPNLSNHPRLPLGAPLPQDLSDNDKAMQTAKARLLGDDNPQVNKPKHYDGDECMQVLEAAGFGRDGCLFNIGKYMWRLGKKGDNMHVQDCQKTLWYARRFAEKGGYGIPMQVEDWDAIELCVDRGLKNLTEAQRAEVRPLVQRLYLMLRLDDEEV